MINSYAGAQSAQSPYQGAALGGSAVAPRTISSAASRMDSLNERLAKIRNDLEGLSDQIGGPREITGNTTRPIQAPPSVSVVGRLNDTAEYAHDYLGEIESLLGSIGRALG